MDFDLIRSFRRTDATPNPVARAAARDRLIARIAEDSPPKAASRIRVVIADDFALVREGVMRALNSDPAIEVIAQAENGLEALDLAEKLTPDVMILDLRMPELGGLAVVDKLRASRASIRVIVMTASERASSLLDAIAAGAAGYLSKRSTGEELRQAVITAHGGGWVITPSLASHLLKEYSSAARSAQSPVRPLQGRELDVLRLVVQGKTDEEIGKELFISPRTVQNHLTRIREKTGLRRDVSQNRPYVHPRSRCP